ncbi:MAG TPA: thioredoxin domain-containing protein [Candidatus Babeliales bacterium]|nr:thioredoxin domain-containing protein [Candidatus Babeliales bacterium]
MNMLKYWFFPFLALALANCGSTSDQPEQLIETEEEATSSLYNLEDSATIVLKLIQNDTLNTILEDADPDMVDLLIKNFSPVEIAFESEVLNCTLPVLVYFFNPESAQQDEKLDLLEELAEQYDNQVKIVIVDATRLTKITERAEIETFPSCMVIINRKEIERLEDPNKQQLIKAIEKVAVDEEEKN